MGDVRDRDRLDFAFKDCDVVIHVAAIKHVPFAEEKSYGMYKNKYNGS